MTLRQRKSVILFFNDVVNSSPLKLLLLLILINNKVVQPATNMTMKVCLNEVPFLVAVNKSCKHVKQNLIATQKYNRVE